MNFTGGNTLPNIGKRINWQLVMLAGGLAVALAAGAIAGVFERESSPASTAVSRPQTPAIPAPVVRASGVTNLIYVLVSSQSEAETLRFTLSTAAAERPEVADEVAAISVVVLQTPADEAELMEVLAHNPGLGFVDLRTRATILTPVASKAGGDQASPIVYLVASEAEKLTLEQQFHESGALGDTTPRSMFVLDGPDADRLYNTIVGDQMEHGTFEIVDLRN